MRFDGPIHRQVRQFTKTMQGKYIDFKNLDITYTCSDLIRTQQTLCTFRFFLELEKGPPLLTSDQHMDCLYDFIKSIENNDVYYYKSKYPKYKKDLPYLEAWSSCLFTSLSPKYLKRFYIEMSRQTFFEGEKRTLLQKTMEVI